VDSMASMCGIKPTCHTGGTSTWVLYLGLRYLIPDWVGVGNEAWAGPLPHWLPTSISSSLSLASLSRMAVSRSDSSRRERSAIAARHPS